MTLTPAADTHATDSRATFSQWRRRRDNEGTPNTGKAHAMTDELKFPPCPFCGAPVETIDWGDYRDGMGARCSNEDCPVRPGEYDGGYMCGITAWRTRPIEDALRAKWEAIPWKALWKLDEDLWSEWGTPWDALADLREWLEANKPTTPPAPTGSP